MTGPEHDVWSGARARAREEVRAAFAPQRRVCRACGHEEETNVRACPRCGTPYVEVQEPGMSRRQRRRLLIGTAVVLVLLVAGAIAIVPAVQREKQSSGARQRAADAATVARERQRIARDQRPHTSAAPRGAALRPALEAAITADARNRVRAGTLQGPVVRTSCAPVPGVAAAYRCEAVNAEIVRGSGQRAAGTLGYPFWARVDRARRRFTWCKVNPQAGEGSATPGAAALIVPVARACDVTRR